MVKVDGCLKNMSKLSKRNKTSGFTLLEVLLSIAVIGLIAGIGTPIYLSLQTRNDLYIAENSTVHSLRHAQLLSQIVDGDSSWGIYLQNGSVTIFRGLNYSSRNTDFDKIIILPGNITTSGVSEIIYEKFTGIPLATGTITLTSNANEIKNITVNSKGMVGY
ncbi:hypothetical protein A2W32_05195 [candidate division WWE3 bacterium RBG_16_37_10]|uniref:General secretion pathway GspH domain-containing protein n=1 Tax=candidate division WWE3 bacterium RBG_16_37_10 TaxID=1802610 RepID=A0A1F4UWB4_UNCKA|nr:MAG: hypothetical protein A2W32_05195 [candidate division WWE3 bacterium RBG_16_37_10]